MMYKAKVAVCSEIRTKHSKQGAHHVRKETARLWKVNAVAFN